jgi:MFS family permease
VTDFLDVPLASVVLPEYAQQNYGSAVSLGAIMGAVAAGAFVGMLLFGAVGRRQPRRLTFIVSLVVGAVDPDATCCDPRAQGYRGRFANWAAKSRI